MMLPPTQLRDGRTYGSENLRSKMQKDFFDSIGHNRKSVGYSITSSARAIKLEKVRDRVLSPS
jgi:hypothetical protein